MPPHLDFYSILQVGPTATAAEIRAAYRRAALACHPDKGGRADHFHNVVRAFETLSNEAIRASYDCRRARAETDPKPSCKRRAKSEPVHTPDAPACQFPRAFDSALDGLAAALQARQFRRTIRIC